MQNYIGYGFNVHDVSDKVLADFARKHDTEAAADVDDPNDDIAYAQYIDQNFFSGADYIVTIINEKENCHILTAHDQFISFDNIAFLEDAPERAKRIPNKQAFKDLIAKYLDTSDIFFGSIYNGEDFADNNFWLDF